MKIYIVNITPQSLKNKINLFKQDYEFSEKIKYELNSIDYGLHIIQDNKIHLVESTFNTDYQLIKNYENVDLLIDKSNYKLIPVKSQMPVNYVITIHHVFEFKVLKNSKLSLIIECLEETENFVKKLIPVNFYFNYNNDNLDLKDTFFQEEFNVFLSKLN
uniref:Uncharacterized protein n=1 Tax=viral metagenome TaxID=1070528 RepID=A0A6C0KP95_9ZZZZ